MTLLSCVQEVQKRLIGQRPTTAASSTDPTVLQLVGLVNQVGQALADAFDWQVLRREHTFTTTATETQADGLPTDYGRFCDETMYNRTKIREVLGPLSVQEWQSQKALTGTVLFDAFTIRGGSFLMIPVPAAGQTIAYEYITKNWATDTTGSTGKTAMTVDTDLFRLDEEMVTLGVMASFLAGKGLPYAEEFRNFQTRMLNLQARDGGRRTLDYASRSLTSPRLPGIPEGSWSLT